MIYTISPLMDHLYLDAAFYLAKASSEQGSNNKQNRALAVGALACSVSFLDVCINSLFQEGVSSRKTKFRKALSDAWNQKFDRQPTLVKLQKALALAHVDGFDTRREPYQSVNSLIVLRNAIIHPKTIFGNGAEEKCLLEQLDGKFEIKPRSPYHALFPDSVLTPECAAWGLVAVLRFLDEFNQKLPKSARSVTLDIKRRLAEAEQFQNTRKAAP